MTVVAKNTSELDRRGKMISWIGLANTNTGAPHEYEGLPDRTVQVVGTFDGAVTIEGSNDNSNWVTLYDHLGLPLSFAATGLKLVVECPRYIRPKVAAGTTANNDVYLFCTGEAR